MERPLGRRLGSGSTASRLRCDPTVNPIAAENIDQGVHVEHVVDFNAEFWDEFMAKWKITTIVIGGGKACWISLKKNADQENPLSVRFFFEPGILRVSLLRKGNTLLMF